MLYIDKKNSERFEFDQVPKEVWDLVNKLLKEFLSKNKKSSEN